MKKVTAIITLVTMALMMVIPSMASSFNIIGPTAAGTTHTVKYTDIGNVVKDGIIGENEYEKLNVVLDEDNCPLHLVYGQSEDFLLAENMLPTMEYYASWSEGQINIAVKTRPDDIKQVIHMADSANPDDFCKNVALTIASDPVQTREKGKQSNFYFAVSLTTDTNEYQVAWYDTDDNQRGNSGTYAPTPGQDFVINYTSDGVIFEWSIPFAEICAGNTAAAGDSVYLTITATAGQSESADGESVYGISMGDFGYMVSQKDAVNNAAFLLSDETIGSSGGGGDDTTAPGTTEPGATTAPVTEDPDATTAPIDTSKVEVVTDKDGNVSYIDKTTGETISAEEAQKISAPVSNNTAPRTGDPMIIIAAVSAIGACGAAVIKRKFF